MKIQSGSFRQFQREFTAHIRDPRVHARPRGVPARRMRVYNELLYNNLESFLLGCFPVCRHLLGKRRWGKLVRDFFRDHVSHTPYFRQIPEEFLKYLQDEWPVAEDYPAFLPELAHYEWVELELDTSDADTRLPAFDPAGDLLAGRPLLNPVSRVLAYRWPVHRLSPRFKPAEAPAAPTFIAAWRDAADDVRFSVVNPATAALLRLLHDCPQLTGGELLDRLARDSGLAADAVRGHGAALLEDLRAQGIVLGTH